MSVQQQSSLQYHAGAFRRPPRRNVMSWVITVFACIAVAFFLANLASSGNESASQQPGFACTITTTSAGWQANVGITGPDENLPPIVHFELGFFDASGTQIGETSTDGYDPYVAAGQTMWANDVAGNTGASTYETSVSLSETPSSCQLLTLY